MAARIPEPTLEAPAPVAIQPAAQPVDDLWVALQSASQFEKDQQPAKAIEAYSKALSIKPDLYSTYMDRARLYIAQKQVNLAIADYTAALKVKADSKDAFLHRCKANLESGNAKEAIEDCARTIQLDTKAADSYYYRGLAYSLGNVKK